MAVGVVVGGLLANGVPCIMGASPEDGVPCTIGTPLIGGVLGTIGMPVAGISGTEVSTRTAPSPSSFSLSLLADGFERCDVCVSSALVHCVLVS